jgi:type I restriction enzyme S subunit
LAQNDTRDAQPLPDGWVWTTLEEACQVNPRMTRPEEFTDNTLVSFVPMAAVDNISGAIVDAQVRPIGEVWKGYKRFAESDVIFAKITPCMENGKCAIAKGLLNGIGLGSTEFHVLRASGAVIPQWIYHFVRQESFRADAAAKMTGTAGQLRVPTGVMQEATIPLAPLPEQHRIAAEIETQFTRLEVGVAALKRAQANLRRYKASVLKAACEGRLVPTEAELARAEGRAHEPAEVLLQRILAERRAKWKAENPRKKYKEPALPDTSDLPELPEGWTWALVEQLGRIGEQAVLTGPFGSNLGRKDFVDSGVPILTIGCLKEQGLSLEKAFYVTERKATELDRYRVRVGDLLFSRMATVGRAGLVTSRFADSLVNYHLMRLRLADQAISPDFFISYVRGSPIVTEYVKEVNHGATRDGINTKQLMAMPVSLPPLAEQRRIVAEVERRLSLVQELEKQVEAALRRAERLRQAILKHAFEGKLVPQDPSDEPATELLERIEAERSGQTRKAKGEKRRAGNSRLEAEEGDVEQLRLL